jgi:hypothetical protein
MISMFYGILVSILFEDERHKLPHILVQYTEYKASISFSDGRVLAGDIPPKQIKMVQAWIKIHHDEPVGKRAARRCGRATIQDCSTAVDEAKVMLLDVIRVAARPDYTLVLEFENGEERVFDMSHLMSKKPFDLIKHAGTFERATVDYGTVVWPGNIDISPETLYDRSKPV